MSLADTSHFVPQFVLTKEGQFMPWEDYTKNVPEIKKKYLLNFTRTCVFVNEVVYAIKTLRSSTGSLSEAVKNVYKQDDKSLIVYTNGWSKMDTGKESIIGFLM